jgi:hypothetical protein
MLADPAFRKDVADKSGDLNPLSGQALTKMVHETMDLPKGTIEEARSRYEQLFPKAK